MEQRNYRLADWRKLSNAFGLIAFYSWFAVTFAQTDVLSLCAHIDPRGSAVPIETFQSSKERTWSPKTSAVSEGCRSVKFFCTKFLNLQLFQRELWIENQLEFAYIHRHQKHCYKAITSKVHTHLTKNIIDSFRTFVFKSSTQWIFFQKLVLSLWIYVAVKGDEICIHSVICSQECGFCAIYCTLWLLQFRLRLETCATIVYIQTKTPSKSCKKYKVQETDLHNFNLKVRESFNYPLHFIADSARFPLRKSVHSLWKYTGIKNNSIWNRLRFVIF